MALVYDLFNNEWHGTHNPVAVDSDEALHVVKLEIGGTLETRTPRFVRRCCCFLI